MVIHDVVHPTNLNCMHMPRCSKKFGDLFLVIRPQCGHYSYNSNHGLLRFQWVSSGDTNLCYVNWRLCLHSSALYHVVRSRTKLTDLWIHLFIFKTTSSTFTSSIMCTVYMYPQKHQWTCILGCNEVFYWQHNDPERWLYSLHCHIHFYENRITAPSSYYIYHTCIS